MAVIEPDEAPIGTTVASVGDVIELEIEATPSRCDCTGQSGQTLVVELVHQDIQRLSLASKHNVCFQR